jgi:subtilisin family serine protease
LRSDPHGHGTQVAGLIISTLSSLISLGIIGGKGFGVNPLVNLIDVRVIDANGSARTDNIIAGLDFAVGMSSQRQASLHSLF